MGWLKSYALAIGSILLFLSSVQLTWGKPCGDGFGDMGDAQVCFDDHLFMRRALRNTDNGSLISRKMVQKRLKNNDGLTAVALIEKGQACAVKMADEVSTIYSKDKVLNDLFIDYILKNIEDHIDNIANNDCIIEMNLLDSKKVAYAIIDFAEQPPNDGVPDGLILFHYLDNNHVVVRDALYIEHHTKKNYAKTLWNHPGFAFLATIVANVDIYQLSKSGFVTTRGDGRYFATYLYEDQSYRTFRVCTQQEMKSNYTEPSGPIADLLSLADSELAVLAIAGVTHKNIELDPSAYILCGDGYG